MSSKFVLVILFVVSASTSAHDKCKTDCADKYKNCSFLKNFCHINNAIKSFCPLSCGQCTLCPVIKEETPKCVMGTCKDILSPVICEMYKNHKYGCTMVGVRCSLTCGLCQNCQLPPTKPVVPTLPTCSDDCSDDHSECSYWEKSGYCDPEQGFPDTRNVCAKSCGVCRLCPVKKQVLPPTRKEMKKF